MINYIYTITNVVNGKVYVGRTNDHKHRKSDHFNLLKRNKHGNIKLQRSYNKHGVTSFVFDVVEEGAEEIIESLEAKWFAVYNNDLSIMYNCHLFTIGGPDKNIKERMDNFVADYRSNPVDTIKNRDSYGIAHKSFSKHLPSYGLTLEDVYMTKWRDESKEKAYQAYLYKIKNNATTSEALRECGATATTFYKYLPEWKLESDLPVSSKEKALKVLEDLKNGISMNVSCKSWRIAKDTVKKYCDNWSDFKHQGHEKNLQLA